MDETVDNLKKTGLVIEKYAAESAAQMAILASYNRRYALTEGATTAQRVAAMRQPFIGDVSAMGDAASAAPTPRTSPHRAILAAQWPKIIDEHNNTIGSDEFDKRPTKKQRVEGPRILGDDSRWAPPVPTTLAPTRAPFSTNNRVEGIYRNLWALADQSFPPLHLVIVTPIGREMLTLFGSDDMPPIRSVQFLMQGDQHFNEVAQTPFGAKALEGPTPLSRFVAKVPPPNATEAKLEVFANWLCGLDEGIARMIAEERNAEQQRRRDEELREKSANLTPVMVTPQRIMPELAIAARQEAVHVDVRQPPTTHQVMFTPPLSSTPAVVARSPQLAGFTPSTTTLRSMLAASTAPTITASPVPSSLNISVTSTMVQDMEAAMLQVTEAMEIDSTTTTPSKDSTQVLQPPIRIAGKPNEKEQETREDAPPPSPPLNIPAHGSAAPTDSSQKQQGDDDVTTATLATSQHGLGEADLGDLFTPTKEQATRDPPDVTASEEAVPSSQPEDDEFVLDVSFPSVLADLDSQDATLIAAAEQMDTPERPTAMQSATEQDSQPATQQEDTIGMVTATTATSAMIPESPNTARDQAVSVSLHAATTATVSSQQPATMVSDEHTRRVFDCAAAKMWFMASREQRTFDFAVTCLATPDITERTRTFLADTIRDLAIPRQIASGNPMITAADIKQEAIQGADEARQRTMEEQQQLRQRTQEQLERARERGTQRRRQQGLADPPPFQPGQSSQSSSIPAVVAGGSASQNVAAMRQHTISKRATPPRRESSSTDIAVVDISSDEEGELPAITPVKATQPSVKQEHQK